MAAFRGLFMKSSRFEVAGRDSLVLFRLEIAFLPCMWGPLSRPQDDSLPCAFRLLLLVI